MTRNHYGIMSGEERDDDMAAHTLIAASTVTCETTFTVGPGTRVAKFPTNTATSAARSYVGVTQGGPNVDGIYVLQGWLGASAMPSTTVGVITNSQTTPSRFVRLNTAGKVEVYDKAGTLWATSASVFPTSGAAALEWMVAFDTITNTSSVLVILYVNRQIEAIVPTGLSRASFFDTKLFEWGENNVASSKGADLYMTHGVYTYCDAASDSPLLKPWPSLYVISSPTADAESINEWEAGTTATPNGWQDVDDRGSPGAHPGHDSDTGRNQSLFQNKRFLNTYSAANPLASTDIVHAVFVASTGSNVSGSKVSYYHLLRLGGTDLANTSHAPGAGYTGFETPMSRPGGGAWAVSDFEPTTLAYGARTWTTAEAGANAIGAKMTDLALMIVYQNAGAFMQTLDSQPTPIGFGLGVL